MLKNLFAFPIVMIDGDEENEKTKLMEELALDSREELSVIHGEAELPYFDFMGITDRWIPTEASRDNAKKGNFDHCMVLFQNAGTYICPWPKAEFKKRIEVFAKTVDPPKVVVRVSKKKIDG